MSMRLFSRCQVRLTKEVQFIELQNLVGAAYAFCNFNWGSMIVSELRTIWL